MPNYEARLQAFAEKVKGYYKYSVAIIGADGRMISNCGLKTEQGQTCDCCGTKRLKTRYPIAPKDIASHLVPWGQTKLELYLPKEGEVYWIGVECLESLEKLGAICRFPGSQWREIEIEEVRDETDKA